MRNSNPTGRSRRLVCESFDDLETQLSRRLVGQDNAVETVIPYVRMFQSGLAPDGRPVGTFLLLGPTGTGKTKTVEALADVLHGSERHVLRVDCGEFQLEHEVAKLIGAPPGYLGHRETQPMLNQMKLNSMTSERCGLSIVLFDEIEKAAPSMGRLLLGMLDKATLRLGDNSTVNFTNSLIFMTSNLGARGMQREISRAGFARFAPDDPKDRVRRMESAAMSAVRRRFSPEFVNRIDASITYHPLESPALARILDIQLDELQRHIRARLGPRAFCVQVTAPARRHLLDQGTSQEYGARHLKRAIHKLLMQPLAAMTAAGRIDPGGTVYVERRGEDGGLRLRVERAVGHEEDEAEAA